ncbi:substrate-binding domain-containing protein [Caproiciproducens sp.]|uniref:substrate-binding domain-containing protein n=1 Tax=Caproiciproducens sp. TaxID=1954376 RepID=UPI0028974660|nr:substrate-binding domain-containing protein [Caproiciproducens sp.]
MRGFLAMLLCAAVLLSLFPGCSRQEPEKVEYLIGVSQANMRESWRLALTRELKEEAAKHPGVRLIFTDATQNSDKQIADIKRLLACGVDLLIVSPCDVKKITPMVSGVYKSIPVIVMDRVVEGYDYSLFIGPDNRSIGKQAGKSVLSMLDGKPGGVLEICGSASSQMSAERSEGFQTFLSQSENISIRKISIENESRDTTEDYLLQNRDQLDGIRIIFAHNDYMALGACRAIEKLGLKNVRIIGVDGFTGENDGIGLVKKGMIDETITCPTGGREAIRFSLDILQNVAGVPKQEILHSHKVTKENVDAFVENLNKPQTAPPETIRVGYAQVGTESAWRLANTESIQSAAKEFGIQLYYENANQSQKKQIEAIRKFIAMKVDVIVLSPVIDSGWDQVLREAKQAGIPVILSDREISVKDEDMFLTFIGADFEEEGRRAMRWIAQNVPSGGKEGGIRIMELQGTVGASPAVERTLGFEEILKEYPNDKIVYSRSGDFTYDGGKQIVLDYLKNHKWDIDVVYAHNDDMALGAAEALEKNGIAPGRDVKIVSIDGTKNALNAIVNGKMNCVVECNPLLGPQLMKAITDLMSGKELPLKIITDEKVFTKENTKEQIKTRKY